MLLYWILIAAANAATYQPALVAIRLKPVEQAQEKVVVAQVELANVAIRTIEEPVHHLTRPYPVLCLSRPMLVNTGVSPLPRTNAAIDIHG